MDNPETVYYNNDWKPVYNPVTPQKEEIIEENTDNEPKKKEKNTPKPLLIIIQIILCAVVLLSFYSLKNIGSKYFDDIYNWYNDNIKNEVILSESFENFSLDSIIDAVKGK